MKRGTWLLIGFGALLLFGGGFAVYRMTRGLRLNNPGNVFFNPNNNWKGQIVPSSDGEIAQFSDPVFGLRAMSKVLDSYARRGLNTIDKIIRTYSATDQEPYIVNVSKALGLSPYIVIDVTDPPLKFALMRAMIAQEQGSVPALTISDETIQRGIALA